MASTRFRLRNLPASYRLALTFLVLVNAGGYVAAGAHMVEHHQNRDEREGLSLTDLKGAYHGVTNTAPLISALERGHPEELAPADKDILLAWLASDRISEDYDNLDLGDESPAEIVAIACLSCHSAQSPEDVRSEPYLDYWDGVKAVAFSRDISATDTKILIASTHTHAIALFTGAAVLGALVFMTRFSRLGGLLTLGASAGLALDIAAWWLARKSAALVYAVVLGGALHAACVGLMMLVVFVELWFTAPDPDSVL